MSDTDISSSCASDATSVVAFDEVEFSVPDRRVEDIERRQSDSQANVHTPQHRPQSPRQHPLCTGKYHPNPCVSAIAFAGLVMCIVVAVFFNKRPGPHYKDIDGLRVCVRFCTDSAQRQYVELKTIVLFIFMTVCYNIHSRTATGFLAPLARRLCQQYMSALVYLIMPVFILCFYGMSKFVFLTKPSKTEELILCYGEIGMMICAHIFMIGWIATYFRGKHHWIVERRMSTHLNLAVYAIATCLAVFALTMYVIGVYILTCLLVDHFKKPWTASDPNEQWKQNLIRELSLTGIVFSNCMFYAPIMLSLAHKMNALPNEGPRTMPLRLYFYIALPSLTIGLVRIPLVLTWDVSFAWSSYSKHVKGLLGIVLFIMWALLLSLYLYMASTMCRICRTRYIRWKFRRRDPVTTQMGLEEGRGSPPLVGEAIN